MRTMVLLVILLLTMGLWSAPVMAGDNGTIQQLPALCQPVSDAELANMNGKQFAPSLFLHRVARCISSKLPPETKQNIRCAVRVAKTISTCIHGAPAAPALQSPTANSVPTAAASLAAATGPRM